MALPAEPLQYTYEDYLNWEADDRIELIDGEPIMMSPPTRLHQEVSGSIFAQLHNFLEGKRCKVFHAPFGVRLFEQATDTPENVDTIVEPDISVICKPERLTEKGCTGAPDWIIEIVSPSNPGHDYVRKLNLYMDAGVREYWIVNPMTNKTAVYCLSEDPGFSMETYSFQDSIKAGIFDDLWIDFREISR